MRDYGVSKTSPTYKALTSSHPAVDEPITLASGGAAVALAAGTVLGKITASSKYVPVAPAAADGSQKAARVLAEEVLVPAAGDEKARAYKHGAFAKDLLGFGALTAPQIQTAVAELEAAGLFVTEPAV